MTDEINELSLKHLLRGVARLVDEDSPYVIERWPYLLPEQKDMLVALLDDLLDDRGSQ